MKKSSSAQQYVPGEIKKRMLFTVALVTIGFLILVIRLATISIVQHDFYMRKATSQQLRDTVITAPRGTIYDTNMSVLAKSATCWTVALSPMDIDDEEDYPLIAKGLSEILDVDYQTVYDKCFEKSYYSIVKRKVDWSVVEEVMAYCEEHGLNGVNFPEDTIRYYPYNNFASQILGFVGNDNQGLYGLEVYYDSVLSGTPGRSVTAKNAWGSDMEYDYSTVYDPIPGNSLILTIDTYVQHYLEKALENAVIEHNAANGGCAIVMNVNTGEILGLAIKGWDFDPNDPFTIFDEEERARIDAIADETERLKELSAAREKQWRIKAVADLYEPGSVFKVVTASSALETGACDLNSSFYCNGSFTVLPGISMSCANHNGHGSENFTQAIVNSCNPAFIQIGQRLGQEDFYKYFKAFGLTEKTGIDIPGEAQSIYYDDTMSIVSLASCSYGQSNAITPIQMVTAFSAVVNGGYLVQPHLVRQIVDSDGNIVQTFDYDAKRQVISEETSAMMAEILEKAGKNAYVSGFRIGGKSGTSQKLGGTEGSYIASFCAFAPSDDPEIAIFMMLDDAHSYSIYGGTLVAPVVGSVMKDVLPYLGVDPIYSEDELQQIDIAAPNVTGFSLTSAYATLQQQGYDYQVIGDGTTVVSQFPQAGQSVPRGCTVFLYTTQEDQKVVTVPDVSERSVDAVRSALKAVGLNLRVAGSESSAAFAVGQNIEPGTTVVAGTVITVSFVTETADN